METILPLLIFVGGLAVAFAGRRLLKFAMAFAGFLLFFSLVRNFLPAQGGWVQFAIAGIGGLIGAWLAIRFLNFILFILGFTFIGYAAWALAGFLGVDSTLVKLAVFVLGGLIGVGLVRGMFSLAVVIITALGGAAAASYGAQLLFNQPQTGQVWILVFLGLAFAGALSQWTVMKGKG
jgi:hypothetical protein